MAAIGQLEVMDIRPVAVAQGFQLTDQVQRVINTVYNPVVVAVLGFIQGPALKEKLQARTVAACLHLLVHDPVLLIIIIRLLLVNHPPPERGGKNTGLCKYLGMGPDHVQRHQTPKRKTGITDLGKTLQGIAGLDIRNQFFEYKTGKKPGPVATAHIIGLAGHAILLLPVNPGMDAHAEQGADGPFGIEPGEDVFEAENFHILSIIDQQEADRRGIGDIFGQIAIDLHGAVEVAGGKIEGFNKKTGNAGRLHGFKNRKKGLPAR